MNFYNDIDPYACEWLQALIDAGKIPEGIIDDRSIADIQPADLEGYTQVHFFAGIGGWPLALSLAGWPATRPVWTGSCPCQPFSCAGKGKGEGDERHLWPEFYRLIRKCKPATIFGEQVASKAGLGWLDGVFTDLEDADYTCGAADLCAAGFGAPHIRQRLWWVGNTTGSGERAWCGESKQNAESQHEARRHVLPHRLGNTDHEGPQGRGEMRERAGELTAWAAGVAIPCLDGKSRRISTQPGDEPLAYGIPRSLGHLKPRMEALGIDAKAARRNRKGRLSGYGNAIVPQVAATFIESVMAMTKRSEKGNGAKK